ncbi:MAG TPA: 4-(cytidine 5'-diphospho)-2-C-methyl-D-erythritol kinase [Acidimicrobiia bacterium]|nr:4-(cytidine 5'-diphospho)-2-C-methyl-D-erythritol kinase [Acidimicrobiia bacterium]
MADDQVVIRAPAKVNLSLRVRPRDWSGRHPLLTLFQAVTLFDLLEVVPDDEDTLTIEGAELDDGPENLVWRAVEAVRASVGRDPRLRIHLTKRIALAAGLGGGSADAAAALEGLRHLLGSRIPSGSIAEIAEGLGSDVPFARLGGTAMGASYGERLSPLDPAPGGYALAIVVPPFELSTPAVYTTWDQLDGPEGPKIDGRQLPPSLRAQGPLQNDLYPAARFIAGDLADWHADLEGLWDRAVMMSGSGPALFAFFSDLDEARGAIDASPSNARAAEAVEPHQRGAERVEEPGAE